MIVESASKDRPSSDASGKVSGSPESETTVILPDGKKQAVKTDKDGYTPAFEGAGRFAVYAKQVEVKEGEHAGKKFSEIRNYATLVCDVTK